MCLFTFFYVDEQYMCIGWYDYGGLMVWCVWYSLYINIFLLACWPLFLFIVITWQQYAYHYPLGLLIT